MENQQFKIIIADATHQDFARIICDEMESSAKARGTGIAKRSPDYLQQKMREGKAVIAAQDAARLSHMRYTGGVTGYLEVLTNETNAFSAELAVVQARQNELLALVQVYDALGGGWHE